MVNNLGTTTTTDDTTKITTPKASDILGANLDVNSGDTMTAKDYANVQNEYNVMGQNAINSPEFKKTTEQTGNRLAGIGALTGSQYATAVEGSAKDILNSYGNQGASAVAGLKTTASDRVKLELQNIINTYSAAANAGDANAIELVNNASARLAGAAPGQEGNYPGAVNANTVKRNLLQQQYNLLLPLYTANPTNTQLKTQLNGIVSQLNALLDPNAQVTDPTVAAGTTGAGATTGGGATGAAGAAAAGAGGTSGENNFFSNPTDAVANDPQFTTAEEGGVIKVTYKDPTTGQDVTQYGKKVNGQAILTTKDDYNAYQAKITAQGKAPGEVFVMGNTHYRVDADGTPKVISQSDYDTEVSTQFTDAKVGEEFIYNGRLYVKTSATDFERSTPPAITPEMTTGKLSDLIPSFSIATNSNGDTYDTGTAKRDLISAIKSWRDLNRIDLYLTDGEIDSIVSSSSPDGWNGEKNGNGIATSAFKNIQQKIVDNAPGGKTAKIIA